MKRVIGNLYTLKGGSSQERVDELRQLLGLSPLGGTSTEFVEHSLATAANDFLVASGSGVFVKKTLAETKAILFNGVTSTNSFSSYLNITGIEGGDARTIKAHSHLSTGGYANEFKGEFVNASSTMDGIAAHYIMQTTGNTGTGVMRSIIATATLPAGVAITGSSAAGSWISGGGFATFIEATATLNGTAVRATGIFAKVSSAIGSNMTSCKQVSAATFISALLVAPTAGVGSIVNLMQEATGTALQCAVYLEGTPYCTSFVTFDAAGAGSALQTSVVAVGSGTANTSHALKIGIGAGFGYIPVYNNANFTA